MKTLTIRGIDPELDRAIKLCAKQDNQSINQWVLQALKKAARPGKGPTAKKYHDLDALAGGWNNADTAAFRKNIMMFEKADGFL